MRDVRTWKAKVINGRLVLIDEETDLPDGRELILRVADEEDLSDPLTPQEEESIQKGLASLSRGEGIPYAQVKAALDRILKS